MFVIGVNLPVEDNVYTSFVLTLRVESVHRENCYWEKRWLRTCRESEGTGGYLRRTVVICLGGEIKKGNCLKVFFRNDILFSNS